MQDKTSTLQPSITPTTCPSATLGAAPWRPSLTEKRHTHPHSSQDGGAWAQGWRADVGGGGDFGPCSRFWPER